MVVVLLTMIAFLLIISKLFNGNIQLNGILLILLPILLAA